MRAIALDDFGGPDRLHEADLPEPRLAPDGLLVRARAAGVNPVDAKIRQGGLDAAFPHFFPLVPGWDVAGVVEQVGPAVTRFAPGDEVCAYVRKHVVQEGTYAELVSVPEEYAAPKPASLGFAEAAALPLAGLTALQAVRTALEVARDDRILVQAAAGGVGSFAVQIAADLGAHVVGTASAAKHEFIRELGAAEAIDYREADVGEQVRAAHPDGLEAVLDVVGGDTLADSVGLLRDGGRLVSIADPPEDEHFSQRAIVARYVFVRPNGAELAELGEMVEAGRLRVILEETLPLAAAARAHELVEAGRVRGKLALSLD